MLQRVNHRLSKNKLKKDLPMTILQYIISLGCCEYNVHQNHLEHLGISSINYNFSIIVQISFTLAAAAGP